jgi:hypothetical protein
MKISNPSTYEGSRTRYSFVPLLPRATLLYPTSGLRVNCRQLRVSYCRMENGPPPPRHAVKPRSGSSYPLHLQFQEFLTRIIPYGVRNIGIVFLISLVSTPVSELKFTCPRAHPLPHQTRHEICFRKSCSPQLLTPSSPTL